jgi:hypothetical protein
MVSVGNVIIAVGLIVAASSSCCLVKSAITSWASDTAGARHLHDQLALAAVRRLASQAPGECHDVRYQRRLLRVCPTGS